ncbi:hypothetical protein Cgig2_033167 [Carnegiea gigantea]|uniref:Uncharacterized protein n=1 Tax=Carnegiea gigantea TaxID=171969 RepID=A0A9Q1GUQ8_9CARY|nr:hypothetical protein Cgig2_033167 [Carnegiea gigantea]
MHISALVGQHTSTQSWIPIERAVIKSIKLTSLWDGAYQKIVGHIKDLKKYPPQPSHPLWSHPTQLLSQMCLTGLPWQFSCHPKPEGIQTMSKSPNGRRHFPGKCGHAHKYFSKAAIWLELRKETLKSIISTQVKMFKDGGHRGGYVNRVKIKVGQVSEVLNQPLEATIFDAEPASS